MAIHSTRAIVLFFLCVYNSCTVGGHELKGVYTADQYPKSGSDRCAGPFRTVLKRICDPVGILSDAGGKKVDQKLVDLEEHPKFPCGDGPHRGFQLGVALLERMAGQHNIEQFSRTVFNRWGIGHHQCNNGILLVLSRSDRKNFIKTGKGAKNILVDKHAADILVSMRPYLRKGQYDAAIELAVDRIINEALVNGEPPFKYWLDNVLFGIPLWLAEDPFSRLLLPAVFGVPLLCYIWSTVSQAQRKKQFETKLHLLQQARSMQSKRGDSNCCNAPCPVCLEQLIETNIPGNPSPGRSLEFKDSAIEHGVELLMCGHVFHHKCIEKWLSKRDSCPICRKEKPRISGRRDSSPTPKARLPRVATPDDDFWARTFENLTSDYSDVPGVSRTWDSLNSERSLHEVNWFASYRSTCATIREEEAAREAELAAERAAQRNDDNDWGGSSDWGGGDCDGGGGAGGDW